MFKQKVITSVLILAYGLFIIFGFYGGIGYAGVIAMASDDNSDSDSPAEEDSSDEDVSTERSVFGRSDPNSLKNISEKNLHVLYTAIYNNPRTLVDDVLPPQASEFNRFYRNGPVSNEMWAAGFRSSDKNAKSVNARTSRMAIFKKRFSREYMEADLCWFVGCWHMVSNIPMTMSHPGRQDVGYDKEAFNDYESHDIAVLGSFVRISTWLSDGDNTPSDGIPGGKVGAPSGVTSDNLLWYFMSPFPADGPNRELTADRIQDISNGIMASVFANDGVSSSRNANDGFWVFGRQVFRFGDEDVEVSPVVQFQSIGIFSHMVYDNRYFNFFPDLQSPDIYQPSGLGGHIGGRMLISISDTVKFFTAVTGLFTADVAANSGIGDNANQGKTVETSGYYNSLLSTNKGLSGGVVFTIGMNARLRVKSDIVKFDFLGSVTGGLGSRRHKRNLINAFANNSVKYSLFHQVLYKAKDVFSAEVLSGNDAPNYLTANISPMLRIHKDDTHDLYLAELHKRDRFTLHGWSFFKPSIPPELNTDKAAKALAISQHSQFVVGCSSHQNILPEATWLKAVSSEGNTRLGTWIFGPSSTDVENTKVNPEDLLMHTESYCVDMTEDIGERVASAYKLDTYLHIQSQMKLTFDFGEFNKFLTGFHIGLPISASYLLAFFQPIDEFTGDISQRKAALVNKKDVVRTLKSVLSFRGTEMITFHKLFFTGAFSLSQNINISTLFITVAGSVNASFSAIFKQIMKVKARAFVDNDDNIPSYSVTYPKYYRLLFGGVLDFSGVILDNKLKIGSKIFFNAGSAEKVSFEFTVSYLR